jgi:hypothetical protein
VEDYENGLHTKRIVGEYTFDLQYKPSTYLLLQQQPPNGLEANVDPAALTAFEEMQYYTLTVGLSDLKTDFIDYHVSNVADQQRKLYYFSYSFQHHIYVEEGGIKYPCLLFHFERSYDLKPTRTFVLGFGKPAQDFESARLVIQSPWFGTEPVNFTIEKKNIPTIKI